MAYNRLNLLHRYRLIRDVYLQHINEDRSASDVYRKVIRPTFFISIRTFNTVLATNFNNEYRGLGFTDLEIENINHEYAKAKEKRFEADFQPLKKVSTNPYLQPARASQIF